MHRVGVVVGLLCFANLVRADEVTDILDHAIKAHSGKAGNLEKTRRMILNQKGVMFTPNGEVEVTRRLAIEGPQQYRSDFEVVRGGSKLAITFCVDRTTGWNQLMGNPAAVGEKAQVEEWQETAHEAWLATLLPLKDKAFKLTLGDSAMVNGEAAVTIKAAMQNRPEVTLNFDKKTGYLVRTQYRGKDNGLAITKECVYSDFQAVQGMMLPTKYTDSFEKIRVATWKVVEYKFPEKFEKSTFAKP